MDQLVNVIFDIKFVIGISVLLVILVIWLIVNTVRSKGFKKELNELKKRYNDIKNVPVQYKMNKVNTLAKMDEDTTKKSKEAQDVYDAYEESIAKITTGLSDADDGSGGTNLFQNCFRRAGAFESGRCGRGDEIIPSECGFRWDSFQIQSCFQLCYP